MLQAEVRMLKMQATIDYIERLKQWKAEERHRKVHKINTKEAATKKKIDETLEKKKQTRLLCIFAGAVIILLFFQAFSSVLLAAFPTCIVLGIMTRSYF